MKTQLLRRTSWTLLLTLLTIWVPIAPVHAAMIGTEQIVSTGETIQNRDRIRTFLQREDVRDMLQKQGVDSNVALSRVDAMTDHEVQTVADQLDKMPAGGSVLGVLFTVFIILLVTDILGLTKVFPFTRSVR
jgi:hypothetical protein